MFVALLLVGLGGAAGWRWSQHVHPPVPALVDATQILRTEGTAFSFTMPEPGPVSVHIELPATYTREASVTLAPLHTALRPDPVYETDRTPEHAFTVTVKKPSPGILHLKSSGPYVLRIEPIPMAMGHESSPAAARVTIRRN